MANRKKSRPTEAELIILRVLWEHGPCSVRAVNRILNQTTKTGYTTTLKQMQVMIQKGLLNRDTSQRPQIYTPVYAQEATQQQLLKHLAARAFGGSIRGMVMQALRMRDISAEELAKVDKMLEEEKGE